MDSYNGLPRPAPAPIGSLRVAPTAAEHHVSKDSFREIVETVVFVIVLVLLLKTFVAEAFVIPTGSMAETLLGYQRWVTCSKCGHLYRFIHWKIQKAAKASKKVA